jgi:hypothetical protein
MEDRDRSEDLGMERNRLRWLGLICVALDRDNWPAAVKTVMNLQVQ